MKISRFGGRTGSTQVKKEQRIRERKRRQFSVESLEQRQLLTTIGNFVWDDLNADGI